MTLRAGTGAHYSGSLAERIEAGLAAELFALRGALLPEAGAEDRRMLFAAIAQGVLAYLAAGGPDEPVALSGGLFSGGESGQLRVQAPYLTIDGGTLHGYLWTPGQPVTLRVLGGATTAAPALASGTDLANPTPSFSVSLASGLGGPTTGHVIDARNDLGDAAQLVIA